MPGFNMDPFDRKNINKDLLKKLKEDMVLATNLEEANEVIRKFSTENNIPLAQDNNLDTLKNLYLLCLDEEYKIPVTFISYARKILASDNTSIEEKNGISKVADDINTIFEDNNVTVQDYHSIASVNDIKYIIDAGQPENISSHQYLKNEKAVMEGTELYIKHLSWLNEIYNDIINIRLNIKFDDRDLVPIMTILTANNPDCTKEEFQKKCFDIRNTLASGDTSKINEIYDQIFDIKDNTDIKTLNYDDKNECYKMISILAMNQAFGTLTEDAPDYKMQRYFSKPETVDKWDKYLEIGSFPEKQLSHELLSYGIAVDSINGHSTVPFHHYQSKVDIPNKSQARTDNLIADYHEQKHKVLAGEADAVNIELTEELLEYSKLEDRELDDDDDAGFDPIEYFDRSLSHNMFPGATNHHNTSYKLGIVDKADFIFIDGRNVKDVIKDMGEEYSSSKVIPVMMRALAEGKAVDIAQISNINGKYDINMIPLNMVNHNNLKNEINEGVDYNQTAIANATDRENRLAEEKAKVSLVLKKGLLETTAKDFISDYATKQSPIDNERYQNYSKAKNVNVSDELVNSVKDIDINTEQFKQLGKNLAEICIEDYIAGSEKRERDDKENAMAKLRTIIGNIENANVATYSSSKHHKFAAVREAAKELYAAYETPKPVTEKYLDMEKKDELYNYYKKINDAKEKLFMASRDYLDDKKDLDRATASERAVNRYDAVKACCNFTTKNIENHNMYINAFDKMCLIDEKAKNHQYEPSITSDEKKLFKTMTDSYAALVNAKTGHDSDKYESLIKVVNKVSSFNDVLSRDGLCNETFTYDKYREVLTEIIDASSVYFKHKATDGLKKNAYGKMDAVINVYESAKSLRDSFDAKADIYPEEKLNILRNGIDVNEIELEVKIEKEAEEGKVNPMSKRFYYLGKNAPNKNTKEKFYKDGVKTGEKMTPKVKSDIEKSLYKGKVK